MELKEFIATLVSPGQPLTAKAWNDLVTAVEEAYKFIQATTHVVKVLIMNPEIDNRLVRVVATSVSAPPVEAVRPLQSDGNHILVELSVGDWDVTAEALGFAPGTVKITVAAAHEQTVQMELKQGLVLMPDVFGKKLPDVLGLLEPMGITVTALLDVFGSEVTVDERPDYVNAPVLVQQPIAGQPVDPTVGARLVVAAAPTVESAIEIPSLVGMTEAEARRTIESLGLSPGKSLFVEK